MFAGILWVISFIATLLAFVNYLLSEPQNVMQQAALAAMTVVYILIPYCLARAFSAIMQIESNKNKNKFVDQLHLELHNINRSIEESSSKLSPILLLSEKINKLSLIHSICFFDENIPQSHDSITYRINSLKNMAEQNIITVNEFELNKKQLLTKFEQYLKQQIEKNQ